MSPTRDLIRVRVNSIEIIVPDSVKQGLAAEFASLLMNSPLAMSANAFASPAANLAGSTCGAGAGPAYTKSKVAFIPERIPNIVPYPVYDDGIIPDDSVRLGFNFTFYGKTYDRVNIYSNGLLLFGPLPSTTLGFTKAGFIPSVGIPNNIIAFAWTDWQPNMVSDPIRFETRGYAPHRKFIIQFNNVPEFANANTFNDIKTLGGLMTQVVLSEGSNDVTIYTSKLKVVNSGHLVTQGIENEAGTDAAYDSVQNVVTGVWSPRRQRFFNLTDEGIRFSPVKASDDEIPSITPPKDVSVGNDPGLASAVVAVGSPLASDNCVLDGNPTPSRSDGAAIDAPYPVGVTTITWTAKDAAGNTASATQSVTVLDVEAPAFPVTMSAQSILTFNATSPSGATVTYAVDATDNVGVTSLACSPASGSVFRVGSKEVSCSASDAAGNSSSKSFWVSVIGGHEQMANLMESVKSLGLPNGTENPLVNQLKSAYGEQGNECKKISDFIDMVSNKSSDIDPDDAAYMTAEANRIMGALGCTPGPAPKSSRTTILN